MLFYCISNDFFFFTFKKTYLVGRNLINLARRNVILKVAYEGTSSFPYRNFGKSQEVFDASKNNDFLLNGSPFSLGIPQF